MTKIKSSILISIILLIDIILVFLCIATHQKQTEKLKTIPNKKFKQTLVINKPNTMKKLNINPSIVSDKTIYLTFDDGPSYLTSQILDILKNQNVPATFFVTNQQFDKFENIVKKAHIENHTVAIHTLTHNYSYIYSSDENYKEDFEAIRSKIAKVIGYKPRILRLPGGSSNTISKKYSPQIMTRITNYLNENNFYYYDWNIDSGDASGKLSKEQIYNNVTSRLKEGENIILMHDSATKSTTVEALNDIINYGKANGYTFAKITKNTSPIHHHINNWNNN